MAMHSDSQRVAYERVEERSELAAVCLQCPYPDCISKEGCAAYRETRSALLNGEPVPEPKWPPLGKGRSSLYAKPDAREAHRNKKPADKVDADKIEIKMPGAESFESPEAILEAAWKKMGLKPVQPPSISMEPALPGRNRASLARTQSAAHAQ